MRGGAIVLALVLAGCSDAPAPAPAPSRSPAAMPTPVPTRNPRVPRPGELPTPELDTAVPLVGTWRFEASAGGGAALYVADGVAAFAIRCDPRAMRIVFVYPGAGATIRLFTPDAAATFPARRIDGALEAAVTTGQTFLDALARADTIGVGGGDDIVRQLPGDRSIGDVVRGCRPAGR